MSCDCTPIICCSLTNVIPHCLLKMYICIPQTPLSSFGSNCHVAARSPYAPTHPDPGLNGPRLQGMPEHTAPARALVLLSLNQLVQLQPPNPCLPFTLRLYHL